MIPLKLIYIKYLSAREVPGQWMLADVNKRKGVEVIMTGIFLSEDEDVIRIAQVSSLDVMKVQNVLIIPQVNVISRQQFEIETDKGKGSGGSG